VLPRPCVRKILIPQAEPDFLSFSGQKPRGKSRKLFFLPHLRKKTFEKMVFFLTECNRSLGASHLADRFFDCRFFRRNSKKFGLKGKYGLGNEKMSSIIFFTAFQELYFLRFFLHPGIEKPFSYHLENL
jgi:hypothetical protein